jgi:2-polyprenyl-3-methyl-5-hydroxy-6-metoxy-1,4-benzoquinol methylase
VKTTAQKVYSNSGNEDVLNLISGTNLKVLDIGCGSGSIAEKLSRLNYIVDGITLSQKELDQANRFLRNGYIFNLENGLPLDINENEYDYVICSHVLEHIAYPDKLLTCIKKVLKKDARIILALPNIFHYKSRLELIKGNFRQEESGIWDYTHLRWYSFISAKNLLKHYKFDIELAKVTGRLPAARFFEFILNEKIRKIFFSILTRMSKGLWGDQLLYIGRNIKN